MIYAHEARTITNANTEEGKVIAAIKDYLPLVEAQIRSVAQYGLSETIFKQNEIMKAIPFVFTSKREIMETLAARLRNFGYETWVTNSASSVHVKW